jgi:subtilisin family serine protease
MSVRGRNYAFIIILSFLVLTIFAQAEEVIITYKNETDKGYKISSTIDLEENLNVTKKFTILDGFVANISNDERRLLEKNDEIVISEIQEYHAILDFSKGHINATNVWSVQLNSTNITGAKTSVCVLDTGVDYTHAAFGGCTNETFLAGTCSKVIGGYDFTNDDEDPMDDHNYGGFTGHGTHVAGIIASQDSVYNGTAPGAGIIAMKVLNSQGAGNTADIISALEWCINNASIFNITSISMSLGTDEYREDTCVDANYDPLVLSAIQNNISIVAAAGNCEGKTSTTCNGDLGLNRPACVSGIIPVGAVDDSDTQYYQRWLNWQVLAPGLSITSLKYPGGGTQTMGGTSMATPFVSATIALLQQYSKLKNNRSLNSTEIITALNTTGKRINDTATGIVYPRLDAFAALGILTNPQFSSINHTNLSTFNTKTLTLPLEIVFNEEVDFTYSINGSTNKTGCNSCTLFNQSIALPRFGNLTFNFYISDNVGNSNLTNLIIYINQTAPTYNVSYIGEPTITLINEDSTGGETNLSSLNVYINNSNNLTINYLSGNYTINLTDSTNQTIIEFNYTLNETNTTLDLSEMVLMKGNLTGNNSYLIIHGLNLTSQDRTKTIYLEKKNMASNNTCIRDAETFSVGEISTYCNGTNEYRITCPGTNGNYACEFAANNTYYKLSGLSYSAAKETGDFCGDGIINGDDVCDGGVSCDSNCQTIVVTSSDPPSSGGGGGGGSSVPTFRTIVPTPYEMKQGFSTVMEEEDVIVFKTTNGEDHNVTVDKLTSLSVKLTINSDPITLLLIAGEERKLNLSSTEFYNLYVKVNLISGDRANIKVQNIFEEIISEEEDQTQEPENTPIYRNYKAYVYLITALFLIILAILTNRKLNKLENETKKLEETVIKENEKATKPKTKRKR